MKPDSDFLIADGYEDFLELEYVPDTEDDSHSRDSQDDDDNDEDDGGDDDNDEEDEEDDNDEDEDDGEDDGEDEDEDEDGVEDESIEAELFGLLHSDYISSIPAVQQLDDMSLEHAESVPSIIHKGAEIMPGATVELLDCLIDDQEERSCFHVFQILKDPSSENAVLRGLLLRFKQSMHGFVPSRSESTGYDHDDFIVYIPATSGDTRPLHEKALHAVDLRLINGLYPFRISKSLQSKSFYDAADFLANSMICLVEHGDQGDRRQTFTFRHVEQSPRTQFNHSRRQKDEYFIGDICHGIGGATEGAKLAGFKAKWAIDNSLTCNQVFKLNHPDAKVISADIGNIRQECGTLRGVADVLLISVPCRTWSKAHTRPGRKDAENRALLFKVAGIIEFLKPRQVVIEQVDGLAVQMKHREAFAKLIQGILQKGYNVSFSLVNFQLFGLSGPRVRLIIFASAPGERHPTFPDLMYGPEGSGLLPIPTIHDVLSTIPRSATLNTSNDARFRRGVPYDPRKTRFKFTITRDGGGSKRNLPYHPSGKRDFTVREYAQLQGFPSDYELREKESNSVNLGMIGDSVPPKPSSYIYAEVMRALKETDGIATRITRFPVDIAIADPLNSKSSIDQILVPISFTPKSRRQLVLRDSVPLEYTSSTHTKPRRPSTSRSQSYRRKRIVSESPEFEQETTSRLPSPPDSSRKRLRTSHPMFEFMSSQVGSSETDAIFIDNDG